MEKIRNYLGFSYKWINFYELRDANIEAWLRKKNQTFVEYYNSRGEKCYGMSREIKKKEPVALYIRKLYMDGVYRWDIDNYIFLLVIKDMEIVPGTGVLMSQSAYDFFTNNLLDEDIFSSLKRMTIDSSHINAIIKEHKKFTHKKKLIGFLVGMVIALTALILVLFIYNLP